VIENMHFDRDKATGEANRNFFSRLRDMSEVLPR
jgi:hypothetical protein